jgi:hypothetical protein
MEPRMLNHALVPSHRPLSSPALASTVDWSRNGTDDTLTIFDDPKSGISGSDYRFDDFSAMGHVANDPMYGTYAASHELFRTSGEVLAITTPSGSFSLSQVMNLRHDDSTFLTRDSVYLSGSTVKETQVITSFNNPLMMSWSELDQRSAHSTILSATPTDVFVSLFNTRSSSTESFGYNFMTGEQTDSGSSDALTVSKWSEFDPRGGFAEGGTSLIHDTSSHLFLTESGKNSSYGFAMAEHDAKQTLYMSGPKGTSQTTSVDITLDATNWINTAGFSETITSHQEFHRTMSIAMNSLPTGGKG